MITIVKPIQRGPITRAKSGYLTLPKINDSHPVQLIRTVIHVLVLQ